jgi:DNA-binding MarR family transcriptional regulator
VRIIKELSNILLRQIGTLSRSVHYISDIKYKELKLQKGQFTFLTRICENPGINFIDLSNMLKVDKATTTKAVQKLVEASYIEKRRDEQDKRGYNLNPTNKALEVYNLIIEEENKNINICFKNFTEDDKKSINKLITKMSKNIENEWIKIKK